MSRFLTLIRHAKSSWDDPSLEDADRPLNDRGRDNAETMGRRLAALALKPDAWITSPAVRTLNTARMIAQEVGFGPEELQVSGRLYLAGPSAWLHTVARAPSGSRDLWCTGHNPGIHEFAEFLLGRSLPGFPTCTVARLRGPDAWADWTGGCAELLLFDTPKRQLPSFEHPDLRAAS